jgi:hypothetical protein
MEDNREMYNKNCVNACTDLKLRWKRKWKINAPNQQAEPGTPMHRNNLKFFMVLQ